MEAEIRDAMAERLGRGVNAHFTTGGGTTVPWGIVTRSAAGHTAPKVSTVAHLGFDDMIELVHSVDPLYRAHPSCAFMFNDSTLKVLRKVKDAELRYIWQPASAAGDVPATILGHRYVINQAMASVANTNRSVVFGRMDKYIARRVRELSVVRLSERFAEFGQVAFIGFARFDGELLDTAAVKHIVHAT
jgi:HK97 family phage major capsid protein